MWSEFVFAPNLVFGPNLPLVQIVVEQNISEESAKFNINPTLTIDQKEGEFTTNEVTHKSAREQIKFATDVILKQVKKLYYLLADRH